MFKRPLTVALLAIATAFAAAPAEAASPTPQALVVVETKFYSDATYTVQVGYKLLDQCGGDVETWGTQTVYKTQTRTPCNPQ